ncbi:MAG: dihydrodipicolinate synthase family protein [Burkholderiaceae bacterium]
MSRFIDGSTRGVYAIAPTPFKADGELDLHSVRTMCDFFVSHGVSGLTILGMMGEAPKLSAEESLTVARTVLEHLNGAIPVVVGVSSAGTDSLVNLSQAVMDLGAAGVMVAPIPSLKTDESIHGYFAQVCQRLDQTPVCLQDYPQTLGVHFSAPLLTQIFHDCPNIAMLKHEDNPGLGKLSRFRALCEENLTRRVSILTGNGAMYLPQEMARGADGAMTGFAFPEMLTEVVDLFSKGENEAGETLFDAFLPLVRHELQPGVGLAIRKYVLAQRGAIADANLRSPGPGLTADDVAEVTGLWQRLNRRLIELGRPPVAGVAT